MMQAWIKKVDRIENNAKRRQKDAKTREFFERVFPELKKQREDKERIQRYWMLQDKYSIQLISMHVIKGASIAFSLPLKMIEKKITYWCFNIFYIHLSMIAEGIRPWGYSALNIMVY